MKTVAAQPSGLHDAMLSVLLGILFGVVLSILLLVLFSTLMVVRDLPAGFTMPLAFVALAGGSFCGGLVSGRVLGRRGFLVGAVTGLLFLLVLLICGALLGQTALDAVTLLKAGACAVAGAVGGILGCNSRGRRFS